ncbi:MAG: NAD-dependent epimerase/dehydratase family protein [Limisphaerales bacterium]
MSDPLTHIGDVEQLEDSLSRPSAGLVERLADLDGNIIFLGAGGKMGPTMARMAKRASELAGPKRRIIAVSRFSDAAAAQRLESWGVEVVSADLLDEEAVGRLPEVPNVVYLAGMKFGTSGNEAATWAMNTHLPSVVCRRYRGSRIVALSTGNVYGLTSVESSGSRESDPMNPAGEYAMSCLGRERMFQYFSESLGIPTALVRLNYACELRYGVMVDIARKVFEGEPVDVSMSFFNTIWQRDANAMILQLLGETRTPAEVYNVTGPTHLRTRDVAAAFGRLMNRDVNFVGDETDTALLSDSSRIYGITGEPEVETAQVIAWIAHWLQNQGELLGKPTHFEARDGKF